MYHVGQGLPWALSTWRRRARGPSRKLQPGAGHKKSPPAPTSPESEDAEETDDKGESDEDSSDEDEAEDEKEDEDTDGPEEDEDEAEDEDEGKDDTEDDEGKSGEQEEKEGGAPRPPDRRVPRGEAAATPAGHRSSSEEDEAPGGNRRRGGAGRPTGESPESDELPNSPEESELAFPGVPATESPNRGDTTGAGAEGTPEPAALAQPEAAPPQGAAGAGAEVEATAPLPRVMERATRPPGARGTGR